MPQPTLTTWPDGEAPSHESLERLFAAADLSPSWWSNAPQGGEGGPHRPMTLALIKGATVHLGSAVVNSVFQLLRVNSIGSGTWTLSIGAIQGAPPGLTRVHYFLYYELPDISCNLFGN